VLGHSDPLPNYCRCKGPLTCEHEGQTGRLPDTFPNRFMLRKAPRPSLDSVLDELIRLRSRGGITQRRVRECAAIKRLPAVAHEAERRGLELDAAAYEVIKCAAFRMGRPDFRLIMLHTLNIEGIGKLTLEERRSVVRTELGLGEFSSRYRPREEAAYLECASALVRADTSPCRDDTFVQSSEWLDEVVEFKVAISAQRLRAAIGMLTRETEEPYARWLTALVFRLIPGVLDHLVHLSRIEVDSGWDGHELLKSPRGDYAGLILLAERSVAFTTSGYSKHYRSERPHAFRASIPEQVDFAIEIFAGRDRAFLKTRSQSQVTFARTRSDHLNWLAELWADLEVENNWPLIFPPPDPEYRLTSIA
jgi:hypothetical protein